MFPATFILPAIFPAKAMERRNVHHILHVYSQFPEGVKTSSMIMYFQADGLGGSPGGGNSWGTWGDQC